MLAAVEEPLFSRLAFDRFFESLDLKYFEPWELLIHTERAPNTPPPVKLWPNIAPTAKLLDEVRAHFGRRTTTSSVWRAPLYNRKIGGKPLGQHQAFTAVDFGVDGVKPRHVADFLRTLRNGTYWIELPWIPKRVQAIVPAGPVPFAELPVRPFGGPAVLFLGGVAAYPTFVHLDTRGINANWG